MQVLLRQDLAGAFDLCHPLDHTTVLQEYAPDAVKHLAHKPVSDLRRSKQPSDYYSSLQGEFLKADEFTTGSIPWLDWGSTTI